ncbi:MAG: bacterial Ig-like domain-containing protein, partial [Christensenellaceae bacterium]|nr:bacterial Ig-like domain-containing protein [Christensenellaceae bacterium]
MNTNYNGTASSNMDAISNKHFGRKKFVFCALIMILATLMMIAFVACKVNPTVKDIAIKEGTFSNTYAVGDAFPSSAKLIVTYTDDSTSTIDLTESMVTGFDTTSPGEKSVTVAYGNQTIELKITVSDIIQEISIKENSTKTHYGIGESFNDTSASIIVKWESGAATEQLISSSMLSGWDTTTIGSKSIGVSFQGKTTSFNITVSGNIFSAATIQSFNTTYTEMDAFAGATIIFSLFDGTNITRAIEASHLTGFDTTSPGSKTVGIEYTFSEDKTAPSVKYQFEIVINVGVAPLNSISLPENSFKTEYLVGESFV